METKNTNRQATLIKNLKRELREETLRATQAVACLTEHNLLISYLDNYVRLSNNLPYWEERCNIAIDQLSQKLLQNPQMR